MTCGVPLLLEVTAVRLVLAFRSSEVMKEFESDVDMRDTTRTSCCVSRGGRVQPGSAGRIRRQRRARDDDFCAVNHLFPPEGRFDECRRCRSHRIFQ